MSVTVTVTNLSAGSVSLDDIYTELGAAGASNASTSFTRSVAQLDSMQNLKALLAAGTVSVDVTASTDNADLLSIPTEQHGQVANLAVDAVAVVTSAVTYASPFPAGVVPNVQLTMSQTTVTNFKAQTYVRSSTNTGFTIALDVTTASVTVGGKTQVAWTATY